ncbi:MULTISPECIES: hypothetical protein [unclassified Psychrobacter]|uniref:hypothetical protein n=1 Tax=unclassified Psychrobacter TaxID=196806 RepID=UPI0025D8E35A|nr:MULTISPECIES: hypothetical protein [unclassified Psychrobacter]
MTTIDTTTKQRTFQRLPLLLATGLLSTGLLLSGCSSNDKGSNDEADSVNTTADTASNSTKSAPAVAETVEDTDANQVQDLGSDANTAVKAEEAADNVKDKTVITSDNINPVTASAKHKSLVTNPTKDGTPEDTVKKALDSLYYGDAKQAATYYKVDMANFEEELSKTQSAFQQTVDGVTFTDTKYNDDKTRATITGELRLKGQSEPAPLTYELRKISGKWKILG